MRSSEEIDFEDVQDDFLRLRQHDIYEMGMDQDSDSLPLGMSEGFLSHQSSVIPDSVTPAPVQLNKPNKPKKPSKIKYYNEISNLQTQLMQVKKQDEAGDDELDSDHNISYSYINDPNLRANPLTREEKLLRNRQAAKKSRKRQKIYSETLRNSYDTIKQNFERSLNEKTEAERKIKNLETELAKAKAKICTLEKALLDNHESNDSLITNFMTKKSKCYDQLGAALNKNEDKDAVERCIRDLEQDFGAGGSQRIALTKGLIQTYLTYAMGDIHKYLITSTVNETGLAGELYGEVDQQICRMLRLTEESRLAIIKKYQHRLQSTVSIFMQKLQTLYQTSQQLQDIGISLERTFDDMRFHMSSIEVGRMLMWFQTNKYVKEVRTLNQQWLSKIVDEKEIMDRMRKNIKIQNPLRSPFSH